MTKTAVALLALAVAADAADRTVLLEEVVNCGCGFCWEEEEALQTFVSQAFLTGHLAVVRIHCSYPNPNDPIYIANPVEQNVRRAHYSVNTQPYLVFDGIVEPFEGDLEAAFAERLQVPAIIDIQVARQGTETSGFVSIMIIAEEDPEWTCSMMIWPILVEDGIPGVGYWTYSQFDQAFRDNLLGYFGQQISFQGPFPDTLYVDAPYEIDPSWDVSQLHLATFVQSNYQSANDEVENTNWVKFIDIPMGLPETGWQGESVSFLSVIPNPCYGEFRIHAALVDGSSGIIRVFDVSGRLIHESDASGETRFAPKASGLYIVTLSVEGQQPMAERVTVLH